MEEEEEEDAAGSDHGSSFQTSFPSQSSQVQQVVEHGTHEKCSDPIQVFKKGAQVFCDDYLRSMDWKMHRFPPSLAGVGRWYTAPLTVAIGPYHHGGLNVLEAEQVKHVAANQCISDSDSSLQEVYNAVFSVSHVARSLYHQEKVADMGEDIFLPMMFFDACFLVQYMRCYNGDQVVMDEALRSYFSANYERICTDIMMLENQIPWVVVQVIMSFMPEPSPWEKFVATMRSSLNNRTASSDLQDLDVVRDYEPPHLLGLVRFYIVGNNNTNTNKNIQLLGDKPMSLSISIGELADVGITVVPKEVALNKKEAAGLLEMVLKPKWLFFFFSVTDLELPPLFLTDANATWLVNMAAFELCKTPDFERDGIPDEDSAVCSYLHLFAMLLDKEQDVHELQKNHVMEGGGLTSKEALEFFTCIGKNMRLGQCYLYMIVKIENFKRNRSTLLKCFLFLKKHKNRIMTLASLIALLAGILSSLQALKSA